MSGAGLASSLLAAIVGVVLASSSRAGGSVWAPRETNYSAETHKLQALATKRLVVARERARNARIAEDEAAYDAAKEEEKEIKRSFDRKLRKLIDVRKAVAEHRAAKQMANLAKKKERARKRKNKYELDALRREEDKVLRDSRDLVRQLNARRRQLPESAPRARSNANDETR